MWLKRLSILAVLLACGVVALGAYTRLKDAGLGCPDWPGCYGHLSVPQSEHAIDRANSAFPERPIEAEKAWAEMIHRYFASCLGLVILIILFLSWKAKANNPRQPIKLPILLTVLVIFQGLLGMWTVTLGLFPTVVMAHLLGGFTTLCLLFLLSVRLHREDQPLSQPAVVRDGSRNTLLVFGIIGIVILTLQIALGGWTAANYAAAVCKELPICQAGWQQHINIQDAFRFWGHGVTDYEFATHLGTDAKLTIHISHRIGAIITTLYLAGLFFWLLAKSNVTKNTKQIAVVSLIILIAQVLLGVSNIILDLPLLVAVAHNGVAAILMMSLILLNVSLYRSRGTNHDQSH